MITHTEGRKTMAKLSKAQQTVMDDAKRKIDFARTHTLREWAATKRYPTGYNHITDRWNSYGWSTKEEAVQSCENDITRYGENYGKYYENEKSGIVLATCNSRTLVKLEQMGLIEIIYDSNGTHFGIDTIKVLNY